MKRFTYKLQRNNCLTVPAYLQLLKSNVREKVFFFANRFPSLGNFVNKKVGFRKSKPTQYSTFKTDITKVHCCMKCPQIIREKTSSQKYTVIALRIQWSSICRR